jgi:hypothetical protein
MPLARLEAVACSLQVPHGGDAPTIDLAHVGDARRPPALFDAFLFATFRLAVGLSPRSPWPAFAAVFAFRRRSCASERP